MVFNLAEEEEEQLNSILLELEEKPKVDACRLGQRDTENTKVRPVKVTLLTSVAVSQILAKARKLPSSPNHSSVYIQRGPFPYRTRTAQDTGMPIRAGVTSKVV